ncbi:MAG: phasin family protein [Oleispira sp.]
MQEDLINAVSEQLKSQYQPWLQINSLWLTSLEKLANFQLNAINSYSQIGLEQVKKAIEINGVEDLQEFASEQSSITESLNEKILDDSKALTELTQEFFGNVESIWQSSLASADTQASLNPKKKTKAA